MSPASIQFHSEPVSPNGQMAGSTPASSTPTIDVSFDRSGLGDFSALQCPPPPLWPHRLSASFSAMADQIAAASQALALVPSTAFSGSDVGAELGGLKGRLEGIERTQERMMAEFEALKTQFTMLGTDHGHGNGNGIAVEESEGDKADPAAQVAKIEELEKKLNELSETVKLDQQRLPARLHNSRATIMKATLMTPVTASGKPAQGFPTSRGEFEHITKERYETLLKAYGQPLKGDTAAKREALRSFAGLPQDGQ
ncbi:hypothetical protein J3R82DRAFT_8607 [Butyriboletus roseoflavus]|nr:hypothetical protein J3R82DRAFT_8607 [Butyriboletus roseoflavus]